MGLKERFENKKKKLLDQYERGKKVTQQMKDERERKKQKKLENMKPSARRAIIEGITLKKHPLDVMKEEYDRRKFEREQKYKPK